jgi:hypothetical protein
MLDKLFGGKSKKQNGFYLELKEDITESVNNIVPAVKETVGEKVSAVKETVEEKVSAVKETVEEKVSAVKETVEEKIADNKPTSTKVVEEKKNKTPTKKKAAKKASAKSSEKPSTESNNGQVPQVSSSASYSETPAWVKAMYKKNTQNEAESETTFATDNLMPLPNRSRRRPGPSLNMFKDMARQAKTPRF